MKSFEKEHPSASSSLLPDEQRQQSVDDADAAAVTTSTWCAVVRLAILLFHRVNDVSTSTLVRRGRNSRWPRADRVEELQQEPEDRVARVRCSRASSPMVRVSATTVETRNSSI